MLMHWFKELFRVCVSVIFISSVDNMLLWLCLLSPCVSFLHLFFLLILTADLTAAWADKLKNKCS